MSVRTFRFRTPATPNSRRLVPLTLIALIAVLFGLLAMHSTTTSSEFAPIASNAQEIASSSAAQSVTSHVYTIVTDSTPASTSSALSASELSATPVFAPTCASSCQLDCLIFGAMCTMTMAAVLTLVLHQQSSPRVLPVVMMRVSALVAQHITLLKPPSLSVLSISRT